MKISTFKEHKASLQKVKNLLEDSSKKIQGVFYTNSFFSQRYLARAHSIVDEVNVAEDRIKLTISSRVETQGLWELDNTLDALVEHKAGDLPGFIPEGSLAGSDIEEQPIFPETVSTTKGLYTADIYLILEGAEVTYQEFKIAGCPFTLVNLYKKLGQEEEFEQTVTLLFGDADKFYFLSNCQDKNLSVRDTKIILDLIMDENITGKVIKGVKLETDTGVTSQVNPYEELISSYMNPDGDYIFGTGSGYVKIPKDELNRYKMLVESQGASGAYTIVLSSSKNSIRLYME